MTKEKNPDLLFQHDIQDAMLHGKIFERIFHNNRLKTVLKAWNYSGKKILDLGCNTGILLIPLTEKGFQVIGADISKVDIIKARKELLNKNLSTDLLLVDGKQSPFKENSFDIILLIDVLEHINNAQEMINSIQKILKPGGVIIVTVPWKYHPVVKFSFIRKFFSSRKTIDDAPDIPFTFSKIKEMFATFKLKKWSLKFYYTCIFAIFEKENINP